MVNRRTFLQSAGVAASVPLLGTVAVSGCAPAIHGAATTTPSPTLARRRLGRLDVTSIGMGVQNQSRKFDTTVPYRPEMVALIRAAYDRGVTFFDTAEAYGPFECERILGDAIASFRDRVVITSKFGWDIDPETGARRGAQNSRPEQIKRAVEGSLRRLRTDRIDLLYQHRVDPRVPIEDVAGAVGELMKQGKVLHWGLSEMGIQTLRRAHAVLPVTAVQNEYSMFYRGPESEVIPVCEELGIGFVPWSPLGQQFLTGWIDVETRFSPADLRSMESRFSPANLPNNLRLVALLKRWAERKSATPSQIALAWLMAQKPWIVPIPGTTNLAHMLENVGATNVSLSVAEIGELNADVRALPISGQRLPDGILAMSGVEAQPKR